MVQQSCPLGIQPFLHEQYAKIKHSFLSSKNIPIFLYSPTFHKQQSHKSSNTTIFIFFSPHLPQTAKFNQILRLQPQNLAKYCGYNDCYLYLYNQKEIDLIEEDGQLHTFELKWNQRSKVTMTVPFSFFSAINSYESI